eukprot:m.119883 g.119883  ORF g.119883 m.119883 type:complete len:184 (-) comp14538_c0_seq9:366-917(-)
MAPLSLSYSLFVVVLIISKAPLVSAAWASTATTFACVSSNLVAVPALSDIQPTVTLVQLYQNQITSISATSFAGLTRLQTLALNINAITSIDAQAFSSQASSMLALYLYNNALTTIPSALLSLTLLSTLEISNNLFTSVPSGAFSTLTKLESLFLNGNRISLIENGAFSASEKCRACCSKTID